MRHPSVVLTCPSLQKGCKRFILIPAAFHTSPIKCPDCFESIASVPEGGQAKADVSETCRAAIRLKTTLGEVSVSHVISDQASIKTRGLCRGMCRTSWNLTLPLHSICCVSICPVNALPSYCQLMAWHTHGNVSPVNTKPENKTSQISHCTHF